MGGHDTLFLACVGMLVVTAQYVYAASGWPCPGLIRRGELRDAEAAD